MASKMLTDDLNKLAEKYSNKAKYFEKRIQICIDPIMEKRLSAQYEFTLKAQRELQMLQAILETRS